MYNGLQIYHERQIRMQSITQTRESTIQEKPGSSHFMQILYYLNEPNLRQSPQNKTSAKKKYLTINSIYLTLKVCQILSTITSHCSCIPLHSQ